MNWEEKVERELLELLEKRDEGNGVAFSDKEACGKKKWREDIKERILQNEDYTPKVSYHLKKMAQSGYVNFRRETEFESVIEITPYGHQRLDQFRANTPIKRIIRLVGGWLNSAVTSIFTPIIVSILTVLVMNYLGLSK